MELESLSKKELIVLCQERSISVSGLNKDNMIKKLKSNERLKQWFDSFGKSYTRPEQM
jgi:hypothetical protein